MILAYAAILIAACVAHRRLRACLFALLAVDAVRWLILAFICIGPVPFTGIAAWGHRLDVAGLLAWPWARLGLMHRRLAILGWSASVLVLGASYPLLRGDAAVACIGASSAMALGMAWASWKRDISVAIWLVEGTVTCAAAWAFSPTSDWARTWPWTTACWVTVAAMRLRSGQ